MRTKKTGMAKFKASSILCALAILALAGCKKYAELPPVQFVSPGEGPGPEYVVGPGDRISIFVWRNPELSQTTTVRSDGRITVPLIEDIPATGQTATQLAKTITEYLKNYIQQPLVTVIVDGLGGPFSQQIRILGRAAKPMTLPYRANMTLLDLMIATGGLAENAAANRTKLIRYDRSTGTQKEYTLRVNDLVRDADVTANVRLEPGDVIIVPESFF